MANAAADGGRDVFVVVGQVVKRSLALMGVSDVVH